VELGAFFYLREILRRAAIFCWGGIRGVSSGGGRLAGGSIAYGAYGGGTCSPAITWRHVRCRLATVLDYLWRAVTCTVPACTFLPAILPSSSLRIPPSATPSCSACLYYTCCLLLPALPACLPSASPAMPPAPPPTSTTACMLLCLPALLHRATRATATRAAALPHDGTPFS
jgi:hypothetical protein